MTKDTPLIDTAVDLIKEKIATDKAEIWIEDNCSVDYKLLIFEEKDVDINFFACVNSDSVDTWFGVFHYIDTGFHINDNRRRYDKFLFDTLEEAVIWAYKLT